MLTIRKWNYTFRNYINYKTQLDYEVFLCKAETGQ